MQRGSEAPRGEASSGDERGQALVEYALIIAIVSLGAVVALGFLSNKINALFSKAANTLDTVTVAAPPGGVTDTTAPTPFSISFPADGATGLPFNPTYTGTCGTALGDLPTVTLNIVVVVGNDNNSPYGPISATCSAGTWSFAQPGPGASQGLKNNRTYQVTASQSDSSGNTASDTNQFST